MRLQTIKSKQSDTEYTKYVFREIGLIKEKCGISHDCPIYFLGYFYFAQVFLCNGKIYCTNVDMEYTENREPSKENDPENFDKNVERLQTLSHNSWCTKSYNAETYLSKGDFHIYLENGKPKIENRSKICR